MASHPSRFAPAELSGRWGNRALLDTGTPPAAGAKPGSVTIASIDLQPCPVPFAIKLRFSAPGAGPNFSPTIWSDTAQIPITATLNVRLRRGLDLQGAATEETIALTSGKAWPYPIVLATALNIDVQLTPANQQVWVEGIVAPLDAWTPDVTGADGAATMTGVVGRTPTSVAATTILQPNARRRGFIVQNHSAANLALLFSATGTPSFAANNELWSVFLPGGVNATYESPIGGYNGTVQAIWDAADATGECLTTSLEP